MTRFPSLQPHKGPHSSPVSPDAGYTLVELLVGVALGAIVLGALGGALLVSQMKVSASIRRDLDRKDSLNRAVNLMRSEISSASKVVINLTNFRVSADLCGAPSLQLSTPGAPENICYRAVSYSSTAGPIRQGYGSSTDRPWTGSCVLMRQGPRYLASGELDYNNRGVKTFQVVLDDLASCSGTPSSFAMSTSSSGSSSSAISRDVNITITQTGGLVTSFSARSGSNPLNSGNDMDATFTGCDSTQKLCRWKIDVLSTKPDTSPQNRNIFYLSDRFEKYTLGACSYSSCTLSYGANALPQLENVDVLVFADKEIRP